MNSLTLLKSLGFKKTKFYKVVSSSKQFQRDLVNNVVIETHNNSTMEIDEYETSYKYQTDKIYGLSTEKIKRNKGDSFWNYSLDDINIWISISNYNIDSIFIEDKESKTIKQYENIIKSKMDLMKILPKKIIREIKLSKLI